MQAAAVTPFKISRFPMGLLVSAITVTFVTLIMFFFSSIYVDRLLNHSLKNAMSASKLYGEIMLLDASLGMSARLAIITGDKAWEEKYNRYDTDLTSAINDAIAVIPDNLSDTAIKNTDLANKKLVRMDREAFQFARSGNVAEAKKIIFSREYETIKQNYHDNMLVYQNDLAGVLQSDIQLVKKIQSTSFIFMIADFILLVLAWVFTYRRVNIWRQELENKIQSEVQYKKEIENARHFLREVLNINKMNDRLQTCQSSTEAYSIIVHTAKELFPELSGGLVIRHPGTNEMETVQMWGESQCLKHDFFIDDCWALREGHVYIVNKIDSGIVCQHFQPLPLSGYLCVPLIVQNGAIGLFELNAGHNAIIPDHQQQLAITFCEVLRLCLGNIFLRETLSEQIIHDPLTGLFNRRYLDKTLPAILRRTIRNKKHACVAMLDIDYFKKINDTYGHDAGDVVLKFIGNYLKTNLRDYDTACRYGGEEFVIIMESGLNESVERLKKLAAEFSASRIMFDDKPLPSITISMGIAEAPTHAATPEAILKLADEALYVAKSMGRNRIEITSQK